MPNPYFKFKQFTVWQDRCAMKVGTLACILGAYASHETPEHILDVGAGTGLLSLMLAQRFPGSAVDAIEIEEKAFLQASVNIQKSPWKKKIVLHHLDFLSFCPPFKYDLIVSNPPFFEGNLKSPDEQINLARHNDQLPFALFIEKVAELLSTKGVLCVLLPHFEMKKLEKLASNQGLNAIKKLYILNSEGSPPKAAIYTFSRTDEVTVTANLAIRDTDNEYSKEFTGLLKAFYLHF